MDFPRYTAPAEMPYPLVCTPMDSAWLERVRGQWWSQSYTQTPQDAPWVRAHRALIAHILQFGGEEVCMPGEESDLHELTHRGEFLYGAGAKMKTMRRCECHANSAALWTKNPAALRIMTGYALTVDGMWRQHTWCIEVATGRPIETTTGRIAYYGVVLDEDEASRFALTNTY